MDSNDNVRYIRPYDRFAVVQKAMHCVEVRGSLVYVGVMWQGQHSWLPPVGTDTARILVKEEMNVTELFAGEWSVIRQVHTVKEALWPEVYNTVTESCMFFLEFFASARQETNFLSIMRF